MSADLEGKHLKPASTLTPKGIPGPSRSSRGKEMRCGENEIRVTARIFCTTIRQGISIILCNPTTWPSWMKTTIRELAGGLRRTTLEDRWALLQYLDSAGILYILCLFDKKGERLFLGALL